jgi:hypothetical protein
MATVAQKSFFAHLDAQAGVLAKVNNALVFFGDDGAITTVEPSMIHVLTVLGETGISDTQRLMDVVVHQGYAAVACSRESEVR